MLERDGMGATPEDIAFDHLEAVIGDRKANPRPGSYACQLLDAGQPHCLLCLVALERPRIRSTTQRRWRLRDRLNGGDASRNAGILARDPHFWDYLQQINLMAYEDEIDTDRARQFINRACRVSGRHEFERSSDAALRFFSLIEEPFLAWLLATDHD